MTPTAARDAEQIADLHAPGRAAEDLTGLEVLHHLARHGDRDAGEGRDAEHGRDAGRAADSPMTTRSVATAISTATVRPLVGLLETPITPTR